MTFLVLGKLYQDPLQDVSLGSLNLLFFFFFFSCEIEIIETPSHNSKNKLF